MQGVYDIVIKIGSMALIRDEDGDIDYNIFSRLGASLRPGMLLVSSGATESAASTTPSAAEAS
jgi:hypothetical protein